MTNEEVMQLMTDMGLHEGGMDDWVVDNAWVKFANAVASAERDRLTDFAIQAAEKAVDVAIVLEREACAKLCEEEADDEMYLGIHYAEAIRARGQA